MSGTYQIGTGDKGTTALFTGARVAKNDTRVNAVGALDQVLADLNAVIGYNDTTPILFWMLAVGLLTVVWMPFIFAGLPFLVVIAKNYYVNRKILIEEIVEVAKLIHQVQAVIASPGKVQFNMSPTVMIELDNKIRDLQDSLPPIKNFILAHASSTAILLDRARVSVRSAERAVVAATDENTDTVCLQFINRLSLYLWLLARKANYLEGHSELLVSMKDYTLASDDMVYGEDDSSEDDVDVDSEDEEVEEEAVENSTQTNDEKKESVVGDYVDDYGDEPTYQPDSI